MCVTLVGGFLDCHCQRSKELIPVAVSFQTPQLTEPDYELQNPGWSPLRSAHTSQVMPHMEAWILTINPLSFCFVWSVSAYLISFMNRDTTENPQHSYLAPCNQFRKRSLSTTDCYSLQILQPPLLLLLSFFTVVLLPFHLFTPQQILASFFCRILSVPSATVSA